MSVGGFATPGTDLDIYVFRIRANQTLVTNPVASAATLADPEVAQDRLAALRPAAARERVHRRGPQLLLEHHGSRRSGRVRGSRVDPDGAGGTAEDDWDATVTFRAFTAGNKPPTVSLAGPTTGRTGEALTYNATASDPDGAIASVAFDLDGDGLHETNTNGGTSAVATFVNPGRYSVGVRVIDANGAAAFSSVDVRITGAPTEGHVDQAQAGRVVRAQPAGVRRAQAQPAGDPLPAP